jgi:hypothetical protein
MGGVMAGKAGYFVAAGVLALLIGASAAEAAKKVRYDARFKAKYTNVTGNGPIGVINFSGRDGDNFAAALTSKLQSASLDGVPIFEVKTLDSMNYRSSGTISRAEVAAAIRLGQKLRVKTVFTGTVTSVAVNSTNFVREEKVCAETAGFLKCKRYETNRIPCTKVMGTYAVAPRAINVATGSVMYSEAVSSQGEYTTCNGEVQASGGPSFFGLFGAGGATAPTVASPDILLNQLRESAAESIRRHVAPYNLTVVVKLKEKAAGLSKPDNVQFENAVKFASAGRMDRACGMFEALQTPANKSNVTLLYNLGICQEVLLPDEPAAALAYYSKADQMLNKPDDLISEAFLRMKAMVGQSRAIRR